LKEDTMNATTGSDRRRFDSLPATAPCSSERPRLSSDEEIELAARVARGDHQARNHMVQANLGLVHAIAKEFRGRGLEADDLIGEGNLGLIRAAEEFDPGFGTRFSTYAAYWIKEAIHHALMNTTATIRLPAWMVGLLTRWRRAERALGRELGRTPGFDELATSLGLSDRQRTMVARALDAVRLRLEGSYADGAGERILARAADRHPVDEQAEAEEDRALLRSRMGRLDERERLIVSSRYGLEGDPPLTFKQIGRRLGITRKWVRKLEIRALCKLGDGPAVDAAVARRGRSVRRRVVPIPYESGGRDIAVEPLEALGSAMA
jgi:RNA polymerase primary sigma factor